MDPIKQAFLTDCAIVAAGIAIAFAIGWAACLFRHRHDVRDAKDAVYRGIENARRNNRA